MATLNGIVTIGSDETPGAATVLLFNEAGDTIVASTTSDPVTGAYSFDDLPGGAIYRVAVMGGGVYRSRMYGPCVTADLWTPANLGAVPPVWLNDESDYTEDSGAISVLNNNLGSLSSATYTQATSGKRPAWIEDALNGRAVIDWNGGQIMLTSDTDVLDLFRNVTQAAVVGVYKLETAPDALRSMLWWSRGTSTASRVALTASDSSISGASPGMPIVGGRRLDGDDFDGAIATAAHVDEWVMVVGTLDFSARIARIYINGVLDNEDTNEWGGSGATSNTRSQQASIGANSSESSYFIGQTAELIATNVMPSSDEIDKLFGYMAHRWGLAASLPAEHPYKDHPPMIGVPEVVSLWMGPVL